MYLYLWWHSTKILKIFQKLAFVQKISMKSSNSSEISDENQLIESCSDNYTNTLIKWKLLSYNMRAISVHLQESYNEKKNESRARRTPENEWQSSLTKIIWDTKKAIKRIKCWRN